MRVLVVLCVLLAAGVGTAWGRAVAEDPSACPYEADPGSQHHVLSVLKNKARQCYPPQSVLLRVFLKRQSTDELRPIIEKMCAKLSDFKSCLADVQRDAVLCLTPLEQKAIQVGLDLLEDLADETCADGGVTLAKIFGEELRGLDLATRLDMLKCTRNFTQHVKEQLGGGPEIPEKTFLKYRFFEGLVKECVLEKIQEHGKSAPKFEWFFEYILDGMQCISPSTEEVVFCSSLDEQGRSGEEPAGELERGHVSAGNALPSLQVSS